MAPALTRWALVQVAPWSMRDHMLTQHHTVSLCFSAPGLSGTISLPLPGEGNGQPKGDVFGPMVVFVGFV